MADTFVDFCRQCGLELEPHQRRIAKAVAGPERETVILIGRDNGKSQLVAAIALWWLVTEDQDVFCVANSRDQAHLVLSYAKRLARTLGDPHVVERFHDLRWCPDPAKASQWTRQLRALAADAGKLHGLKGRWIIDELHAARDDEVYLAARTSSERENSKVVVVSTAAATADSTLGRLRARALSGSASRTGALTDATADNLRMLAWEVDRDVPLDDMKAAKAANPASWITTASLRRLRDAVPEAAFRRYHRNEHATVSEAAWISPALWQACRADYEIEEDERVWVGVDIGGTRARSAVAWVTEDLRVGVASWSGEESVLFAEAEVERLAKEQTIVECAFDPWHFAGPALDLRQRGVRMVEYPQRLERVVPAAARLHAAVSEGRLKHPGDPDLDRAAALAVAKLVPRGWKLDKPGGRGARDEPIDPLTALMQAVDRAEQPAPKPVEFLGFL